MVSNAFSEVVLTPVALTLAPLALLAPAGGLGMPFGARFAWFGCFGITRERASPIEMVGLLIVTAGIGLAAYYGPVGVVVPETIWSETHDVSGT